MYCFIDWVETKGEGFRPNLPNGVGFLVLAEPDQKVGENYLTWAIFDARISYDDRADYPQCEFVSDELALLMRAAESYPPALALARNDVRNLTDADVTREEFSQVYARCLRYYLNGQSVSPYFLAEVKQSSSGYKSVGGFYWIVGYLKNWGVGWVSSDYYVYHSPISDFKIDPVLFGARFSYKPYLGPLKPVAEKEAGIGDDPGVHP